MSSSKLCRRSEDSRNVPDNVVDEILKRLRIHEAARTSVLSKQWRRNWLSLSKLSFDYYFWEEFTREDGSMYWEKGSHIISSILNLHDGPIEEIFLYIPNDFSFTIDHWLSVIAKNPVKCIYISNDSGKPLPIGSHIYRCSELVSLELDELTLKPPPSGFKGFSKLKVLGLYNIKFSNPDIFSCLIANCHQLITLSLERLTGMDHIVLDLPSLQRLTIEGVFKSLAFKNVRSLESIEVRLGIVLNNFDPSTRTVHYVDRLASPCQLQYIEFDGHFCELLAAGGITRSLPVAFNHLKELRLQYLDLGDSSVFSYVLGMIESCPYIKKLYISMRMDYQSKANTDEYKVDYNKSIKLKHLLQIKIKDIRGSNAELELIEYLLTNSPVLQELEVNCLVFDTNEELKVTRSVGGFKRASPEAHIQFLETKWLRY